MTLVWGLQTKKTLFFFQKICPERGAHALNEYNRLCNKHFFVSRSSFCCWFVNDPREIREKNTSLLKENQRKTKYLYSIKVFLSKLSIFTYCNVFTLASLHHLLPYGFLNYSRFWRFGSNQLDYKNAMKIFFFNHTI